MVCVFFLYFVFVLIWPTGKGLDKVVCYPAFFCVFNNCICVKINLWFLYFVFVLCFLLMSPPGKGLKKTLGKPALCLCFEQLCLC